MNTIESIVIIACILSLIVLAYTLGRYDNDKG